MKYLLILIAFPLTFFSCKKDPASVKTYTPEISVSENGLSNQNIFLVINDQPEQRNEFVYGEEVAINFANIKGFKTVDKRIYPAMDILILNAQNDTMLTREHLIKDKDGEDGVGEPVITMYGNFVAIDKPGPTFNYKIYIHVYDRKGEASFDFEMPFTIKENKLLQKEVNSIDCREVYLWNHKKKQMIVGPSLNKEEDYLLVFEGIAGLREIDGLVFPKISLEVTDAMGATLLANENFLEQFEKKGIKASRVINKLPIELRFDAGKMHNPMKLRAIISDFKSSNTLTVNSSFNIE